MSHVGWVPLTLSKVRALARKREPYWAFCLRPPCQHHACAPTYISRSPKFEARNAAQKSSTDVHSPVPPCEVHSFKFAIPSALAVPAPSQALSRILFEMDRTSVACLCRRQLRSQHAGNIASRLFTISVPRWEACWGRSSRRPSMVRQRAIHRKARASPHNMHHQSKQLVRKQDVETTATTVLPCDQSQKPSSVLYTRDNSINASKIPIIDRLRSTSFSDDQDWETHQYQPP